MTTENALPEHEVNYKGDRVKVDPLVDDFVGKSLEIDKEVREL